MVKKVLYGWLIDDSCWTVNMGLSGYPPSQAPRNTDFDGKKQQTVQGAPFVDHSFWEPSSGQPGATIIVLHGIRIASLGTIRIQPLAKAMS